MNKDIFRLHLGIFLIAGATLMYEILLTRVFSVMLWYHFAFMAISIALFGMTLGASLVYLFPKHFDKSKIESRLSTYSLLFSFLTVVTFVVYTTLPTLIEMSSTLSMAMIFLSMYLIVPIPFVMSGVVVCLILSKNQNEVSTLYASDLIGAALGCVALVLLLGFVSVPGAVIIISALAAAAAFVFSLPTHKVIRRAALGSMLVLLSFAFFNEYFSINGSTLLSPRYAKGQVESAPLYEKWNSFSRVSVHSDFRPNKTFGWGLSDTYADVKPKEELMILIDADAGTPLTRFSGDPKELSFLSNDIVNLAHHLRSDASVFVIGVGGGRDVLSAIAFNQKKVVGLEVNNLIVNALVGPYGSFTGHLNTYPGVTIVNDEARSYMARSKDSFDIIQISLIDTWAATAAGAFVLAENSLYTKEAWESFLNHLTPNGILSVSRWYFDERPGEIYRSLSLAAESLRDRGVANPRDHLMVIRKEVARVGSTTPFGVGTILVSKTPFTINDINKISEISDRLQFEVMLTPYISKDVVFEEVTTSKRPDDFLASFPIRIDAPTDNAPFFFNMLRLSDFANKDILSLGPTNFNMKAISTLVILLIITSFLAALFIVVPILFSLPKLPRGLPFFSTTIYFSAIGLGFMMIEIALMQRLVVYLGNPVYGLSVILFSLLLAGGVGSFLTSYFDSTKIVQKGLYSIPVIMFVVAIIGLSVGPLMQIFAAASLFSRIALSVSIVSLIGVMLGMAFPIGMKVVERHGPELGPFLWGVNGGLSVVSSVLAVVVSISLGITATLLIGISVYTFAILALLSLRKREYI